jgi:cell pole-organizing protein PopZ
MEDILASIRRILSEDGSTGQQSGGQPTGAAATLPAALAQPQRNVLALDSSMLVREPQAALPIAAGMPLAALNAIVSPGMETQLPPVHVAAPLQHQAPAPVAAQMVAPAPAPPPPVAPASMPGASMPGASMPGAPMSGAPMSGAPMSGAPMSGAPMAGAPMAGANVIHTSIASSAPTVAPMSDSSPLVAPAAAAAASASVSELMRTLAAERQAVPVYRGGPTLEDIVRDEMRQLLKTWLDANLPPMVERLVRAEIERVVNRSVT